MDEDDPRATEPRSFFSSLHSFGSSLLRQLLKLNPCKNLICSPLAIHSCLGMLRLGTETGTTTAEELDEYIGFTSKDDEEIAEGFHNALAFFRECSVMKIAYKIYLGQDYETRQEFQDILTQKYFTEPEKIDFAENTEAAGTINDWVATQTNYHIKDIVSPEILDNATRMVIINASHFKGKWTKKFMERATRREYFHMDEKNRVKVLMMNIHHEYYYAELKAMDAKALRMSFKDTELQMVIILPNKKTGLTTLMKILPTSSLENVLKQLTPQRVNLKLPRFTAEFEQELTPIFNEMDVKSIFIDNAEFSRIVDTNQMINVSNILHKSIIEINEDGIEVDPLPVPEARIVRGKKRSPPPPVDFYADHPFYFAICDDIHGPLLVGCLQSPVPAPCINNRLKPCSCER